MSSNPVYLKPEIIAEPLVNNWYAWVQLIAPATAALNVKKRHLPIMQSFVNSPLMHVAACKNPELIGGPFINYGAEYAPNAKALIETTKIDQEKILELADSIDQLNELLEQEAKGYLLEPLYDKIPKNLKGLIELEYDINENPTYRIIESMLYKSEFHQTKNQSVKLKLSEKDERPFMLSSPRFTEEGEITLPFPFSSPKYDTLFKARVEPVEIDELCATLELDIAQIAPLLTTDKPKGFEPPKNSEVRIRYFGHACILIESPEANIIIDPILAYETIASPDRFSYTDLPAEIDYVLISHHHQDHIQLETLLQLRHKIKHVVVGANLKGTLQDPSLKLILKSIGFSSVMELDELEEITLRDGGKITGLPFIGEHHDLAIRSRLGYRIDTYECSVTALVDSCNISPEIYTRIAEIVGPTDYLFIGMESVGSPLSWSYGALLPKSVDRDKDQSRRGRSCDFLEAKSLINTIQPKQVYVYAMALEPWLQHILGIAYEDDSPQIVESNKLLEWCKANGIESKRLFGKAEFSSKIKTLIK